MCLKKGGNSSGKMGLGSHPARLPFPPPEGGMKFTLVHYQLVHPTGVRRRASMRMGSMPGGAG